MATAMLPVTWPVGTMLIGLLYYPLLQGSEVRNRMKKYLVLALACAGTAACICSGRKGGHSQLATQSLA